MYSYGDQGCNKPGSKPHHHGIIHESQYPAYRLENEPDLGYRPVRAIMASPEESLSMSSRLNYHKLATIEHNVPVRFIGNLVPDDIPIACQNMENAFARRMA